ncbi:hypothetical protein Aph02nite_77100 [Actinoplanes philippinensis]|uniref:Carboxylesterase n=1 Tax=Actinoplanes philippinensis TaxID=35752 RepID=A0A1I2HGM6_9ACTN|nr:alpha/beta fold hydrolase [Actinoplanes philippinensis]GIE81760.1 hypothetical protein Aph02nite_77100 [Actinoplanes philippinensis]SFF28563.1 carboxylesterase [Actinoplanes philippinensis]
MPDQNDRPVRRRRRIATIAGAAVSALLLLTVIAVFTWPLDDERLHRAEVAPMAFAAAEAEARRAADADAADPGVRPECATRLLSHGRATAKAVLLLHGYTACPDQMSGLADHFFRLGYNVYVPRAPRHGLTDRAAHAGVEAPELTGYANSAWNVTAALGDEAGVTGVSAGAVLATWLAHHRPDSVRHLLALSPFYRPGSSQAPAVAVRPMLVGYGFRLLPDHVNGRGYSYAALAQYLRIAANLGPPPADTVLRSTAVVVAPGDTLIDQREAVAVPGALAGASGATLTGHVLPAVLNLEHDIVRPSTAPQLYPLYQRLYEGI